MPKLKRKPRHQKPAQKETKPEKKKTKLSFKDQFELDTLPQKIESLETEQEETQNKIAEADFYQQDKKDVDKVLARLSEIEKELETVYERWEELSD